MPESVTFAVAYVVAGFLLLVVIVLVTRAFWCWYFRINEIVDLLRRIANRPEAERPVQIRGPSSAEVEITEGDVAELVARLGKKER